VNSVMQRRHIATIALALALFGLLALALRFMVSAWTLTDARMSGHGWTALVLGVVFSVIIGCGLMALMFFSSRRGYDEPPKFESEEQVRTE
jgi:heme/copper-type cytochrome/quinol oxidase subunit 2